MRLPLLDRAWEDLKAPARMPDDDPIETVDTGPILARLAAELAQLLQDAERYAAAAEAANTTRAYASHWNQFRACCDRYQLESLPASAAVIGLYVTSPAKRRLAVSTNRPARRGDRPRAPPGPSPPRHVRSTGSHRHRGHRPLVALATEDLSHSPDDLRIRIARSKTDQQGRAQELLVAYAESPPPCPVRALRVWIGAAANSSGPVFRRVTATGAVRSPLTAQSVALIIKKRALAAGLDPREFAGHSLRAGSATRAARDGHHPAQIAATTRHQDQSVLAGYIRAGR